MARVLIIVGSRREGNSYHLAEELKEGLKRERISSTIITPGNQKIYLCTGCMDCDKNGVCDFNDDMYDNIEKVRTSEILVFITPVRWNTLSGDLKIFIDRLNPLYATKELKDKKVVVLAVGSKPRNEYSTDGAITSLGSFIESAEAKMIYKNAFGRCLDFEDILYQEEKLNNVIQDIINKINES